MAATPEFVAIRDDFLSKPLAPAEAVRLMGSECRDCGEVFLGAIHACANCQSDRLETIPLGREGTLFSYTVVRNRPPGEYRGAVEPFVPFPVGLVELPEHVRILCRLDCPIEQLDIGMPLELSVYPYYQNEAGATVLSYAFRPAATETRA